MNPRPFPVVLDAEPDDRRNIATLTYPGKVDPEPGSVMGPGLDGGLWEVLGTVHLEQTSEVMLERIHFPELMPAQP